MNREKRRSDRIEKIVAPALRFWTVPIVLLPYFFIESLCFRLLLTVLFGAMAVLAGKRVRWMYFLCLIGSIVFFHLLIPFGRVLIEIHPFVLTSGALKAGLSKGIGLTGMVFLSVASVTPNLKLPGRLGRLTGRTLYYFEKILDMRKSVKSNSVLESLDSILLMQFNPKEEDFGHPKKEDYSKKEKNWRGWPAILLFAAIPWGIWLVEMNGFNPDILLLPRIFGP